MKKSCIYTSALNGFRKAGLGEKLPGVLFCLGVATVAFTLGRIVPLIGGPVFGILMGLCIASFTRLPKALLAGIRFSSRRLLQVAIVLMGFGLSLGQIWKTGSESLVVMLVTLSVCLGGAIVLGRMMGVKRDLTALIGAGTGICGASAIAAVAPVIQADELDVAYAISAVFSFNVIAVLVFPLLGRALGFSQQAFGIWAGTAINDTSSVVAAGYTYGAAAGACATVVKLARTMMIIPLVVGIAAWQSVKMKTENTSIRWTRLIPWFILWFLLAAGARSVGLVPDVAARWLPELGKFLIVVALTAVGLSVEIKNVIRTGWRPLALGALLWAMVATTSVVVQYAMGQI